MIFLEILGIAIAVSIGLSILIFIGAGILIAIATVIRAILLPFALIGRGVRSLWNH